MDAAALSAPRPQGAEAPDRSVGLRFERVGGPLVAVCGLVGGAGTSTLAYLIARQAARESSTRVLLLEAEALAGGLAVLAGRATPLGLSELAALLDAGASGSAPPFVALPDGPRLLAALPRPASPLCRRGRERVVADARGAHGLVVADCRTLDHPETPALLALATHVLWTLPATATALAQADVLLASGALPAGGRAREALAAVATQPIARASVRELRRRAEARAERLVLVPHLTELPQAREPAGEAAAAALGQIATFIRRAA